MVLLLLCVYDPSFSSYSSFPGWRGGLEPITTPTTTRLVVQAAAWTPVSISLWTVSPPPPSWRQKHQRRRWHAIHSSLLYSTDLSQTIDDDNDNSKKYDIDNDKTPRKDVPFYSDRNPKQRNIRKPKTPRFAQATTPQTTAMSTPTTSSSQRLPFVSVSRKTAEQFPGNSSSTRNYNGMKRTNINSNIKGIGSNNNNNNNKDNGETKNDNSIDSLETRLSLRFGTDLTAWTARDDEDDDDDDDDTYDQNNEGEIMIRAPRVVDPWEPTPTTNLKIQANGGVKRPPVRYDIGSSKDGTSNNSRNEVDIYDDDAYDSRTTTPIPMAAAAANRNTNMASTRATAKPPPQRNNPLSAFGNSNINRNDSSPSPLRNQQQQQPRMNLRHLIAETPAGGVGTLSTRHSPPVALAPTIAVAAKTSADDNSIVVDDKKSSETQTFSSPSPMLLTTMQAERLANQTAMEQRQDKEDVNEGLTWSDVLKDVNESSSTTADTASVAMLLANLRDMNCDMPLASQRQASRCIRSGKTDVVIGTSTGSGKTLAVLVPVFHRLLSQSPLSRADASSRSLQEPDQTSEDDNGENDSHAGMVSRRLTKDGIQVLIVAPGRELASQIASVARALLKDTNWTVVLAVGGTTFTRNVQTIRQKRPEVLIGTPGRLAELIVGSNNNGPITAKKRGGGGPIQLAGSIKAVVLDEFDALLSESSHADPSMAIVEFLQRKTGARTNIQMYPDPKGDNGNSQILPAPMQTILCSATASDLLLNSKKRNLLEEKFRLRPGYSLAMAEEDTVLRNTGDTEMALAGTRMSRTIIHGVVHVSHQRMALDILRRILHTEPIPQQILVFVSDARRVDIVVDKLFGMGIIAAPLHGGMGSVKTDRAEVSKALRDGTVGLVVATEMAARGLDAPYLTHVINMDLPTDASHYAHRAGRCGRGRRPGVVVNLTTSPQERGVPSKLAAALGITMYTVDVKNAKLNIVDPESLDWKVLL